MPNFANALRIRCTKCMMCVMHPGNTIRRMRQAQGLTLEQLAELSGTSIGYLSDVENDKRVPTPRWLRDVEEALAKAMHRDGAA